MARQPFPKSQARAIQKRLDQLVAERFDGVQARFTKACELTHGTSGKWFSTGNRVPDGPSLVRIAKALDVSIDWLLLGRGEQQWSPTARGQLFEEVRSRVEKLRRTAPEDERRRYDAFLQVLADLGPNDLWARLVDSVEDLLNDEIDKELWNGATARF